MVFYTQEEHKIIEDGITEWRNEVGALYSKGWYEYDGRGLKRVMASRLAQVPQDNKVATQFKGKE